jgi:outer membrane receptor for monomeric catechols
MLVLDVPLGASGLSAGFNASFVGERQTVRGAVVARALVSDLTVASRKANQPFGVVLSIHNLFDARYGDPASEEHRQAVIPQDGRTLSLRATWRFKP